MRAKSVDKRVVKALIEKIKPFTHLTLYEACLSSGVSFATARRYRDEHCAEFGLKFPTFQFRGQSRPYRHNKDVKPVVKENSVSVRAHIKEPPSTLSQDLLATLKKKPTSLEDLAIFFAVTQGTVLDAIMAHKNSGMNVMQIDGKWSIEKEVVAGFINGPVFEYVSRPDNTFVFGATSDNHLCSKHERLDVLNDLYDRFEKRGVDRVFNAGNWIDGEARFNKHEIHTHGMDQQLKYLAKMYPQRPGIVTYAVAGDDHEGWYAQREGVNIGKYAENVMRAAGRTDWVDLGYMEAHIKLTNFNTGKSTMLAVVHPGGGSSYALSYSIQKIIESLDGGEKPAVGLYGHYHKLWAGNIRNVWCLQTGTREAQTSFMRKKKLEAHVGGAIVELEQDPETGAIIGFTPKMIRYFTKGYYNNRWSHSGDVDHAEMSVA